MSTYYINSFVRKSLGQDVLQISDEIIHAVTFAPCGIEALVNTLQDFTKQKSVCVTFDAIHQNTRHLKKPTQRFTPDLHLISHYHVAHSIYSKAGFLKAFYGPGSGP